MTHSDSFASADAGSAAAELRIREATAVLDDAIDDIRPKRRDAPQSPRDFLTAFDNTLREATRRRPYTTLAVAGLAGFLYAALRR